MILRHRRAAVGPRIRVKLNAIAVASLLLVISTCFQWTVTFIPNAATVGGDGMDSQGISGPPSSWWKVTNMPDQLRHFQAGDTKDLIPYDSQQLNENRNDLAITPSKPLSPNIEQRTNETLFFVHVGKR